MGVESTTFPVSVLLRYYRELVLNKIILIRHNQKKKIK